MEEVSFAKKANKFVFVVVKKNTEKLRKKI